MKIREGVFEDWPAIKKIYIEGIETENATFETVDTFKQEEEWFNAKIDGSIFVAEENETVTGWAALSAVSERCVYSGVAEVSVYVASDRQGKGIGSGLLKKLIEFSESNNIWTLQAGIFPENTASIKLHEKQGFRIVGIRKKLGKLKGKWRDAVLMERRSKTIF
jgi:L-amino acid N-acyltransferase YncA